MTAALRSLQRHQPLQEQVYQSLRAAVLAGELRPGERLTEAHLAARLEVSRTPVREALRLLLLEHLAELNASSYIHVAVLSAADAAQLYDCRLALEQQAVTQACQSASAEQLAECEDILRRAEKLVNGKKSQANGLPLLELEVRFHRLIAQASGNSWLAGLLDQVLDKIQLATLQVLQVPFKELDLPVVEIWAEQRRIFELLVQRNSQATNKILNSYLAASKMRIVRALTEQEKNTD